MTTETVTPENVEWQDMDGIYEKVRQARMWSDFNMGVVRLLCEAEGNDVQLFEGMEMACAKVYENLSAVEDAYHRAKRQTAAEAG